MDTETIIKVLEKLFDSSLPDVGVWFGFLALFVLRPINRRLNGVSLYIKKFLAIQQRRAKATEKLDGTLAKLVAHLEEP